MEALRQPACGRNNRHGACPVIDVNSIGRARQLRRERVGLHEHQASRAAVQADRVPIFGNPPDDRRSLGRDVLVDQKECRPDALAIASASSSGGVHTGFGPSSNVR